MAREGASADPLLVDILSAVGQIDVSVKALVEQHGELSAKLGDLGHMNEILADRLDACTARFASFCSGGDDVKIGLECNFERDAKPGPEEILELSEHCVNPADTSKNPYLPVEGAPPTPASSNSNRRNKVTTMVRGLERKASGIPQVSEVGMLRWISVVAKKLVHHPFFENMMGIIIFSNCVNIGVSTQLSLDNDALHLLAILDSVDRVFVVIYIIELMFRLVANGRSNLRDSWVVFDALLVVLGCLDWFLDSLKQFIVLRLLRLLRLLRALRTIQQFRELWKLAYGLMNAVGAMLSMLCLLSLVLFIFACIGIDVITKDVALRQDPEVREIIENCLSSLPRFMMSLLQFATMDSIRDIYWPLIIAKPILILYFLSLVFVVSISLMNLVTAIIVEGALASALADKQFQKREMAAKIKGLSPMIKELFLKLDEDQSGVITLREVAAFDIDALPEYIQEHVDPESMLELFKMLDVDGSGDINEEEFTSGILQLCLAEVPIEVMQILKLVRRENTKIEENGMQIRDIDRNIKRMTKDLHADVQGIRSKQTTANSLVSPDTDFVNV